MGLELPTKYKVRRSFAREKEILQSLRNKVESFERTVDSPIHVSDLLEPRKGYWQRVLPKPFPDTAIMYFNQGYAIHEYLLGQDDEGGTEKDGLVWSPDKRTPGCIIEVKSTTKRTIADSKDALNKWLQQVMAYMALDKTPYGEIWVWYVSPTGPPHLAVFPVEVTKQSLAKYRKQIFQKKELLRQAIDNRDHTGLELCSRELCYRSRCDWYDVCQPEGRWKPNKEDVDGKSKDAP